MKAMNPSYRSGGAISHSQRVFPPKVCHSFPSSVCCHHKPHASSLTCVMADSDHVDQVQNEYQKLGSALDTIVKENERTKREKVRLLQEKTELSNQVDELQQQNRQLQRDLEKAESEKSDLSSKLRDESSKRHELDGKLDESKRKISELESDLKEREARLTVLEREKKQLIVQQQSLEEQFSDEKSKLQNEADRVREEARRELHSVRQELAEERRNLQLRLESSSRQLRDQEKQNQDCEQTLNQVRAELTSLRDEMSDRVKSLEEDRAATKKQMETEILSLKKQLESKNKLIEDKERDYENICECHQRECESLRQDAQQIESNYKMELNKIKADLHNLRLELEEKIIEEQDRSNRLEESHRTEVTKLTEKLNQQLKELKAAEEMICDLRRKNSDLIFKLEKQQADSDETISGLQRKYAQDIASYDEKHRIQVTETEEEMSRIRNEISGIRVDLESKISSLESEKDQLLLDHKREMESLSSEYEQKLLREKEMLKVELAALHSEKKMLRAENESLAANCEDRLSKLRAELNRKLHEKEQQVNQVKAELAALSLEHEERDLALKSEKEHAETRLRLELSHLNAEVRVLQDSLREKEMEMQSQRTKFEQREKHLLAENSRLSERAKDLNNTVSSFDKKLDLISQKMSEQNMKLTERLQQQMVDVSELRTTLREVEMSRQQLVVQCEELRSENSLISASLRCTENEKMELSQKLEKEKDKQNQGKADVSGVMNKLNEQESARKTLAKENTALRQKLKELEFNLSSKDDLITKHESKIVDMQREIRDHSCRPQTPRASRPQTPIHDFVNKSLVEPSFLLRPSHSLSSITGLESPAPPPVFKIPHPPVAFDQTKGDECENLRSIRQDQLKVKNLESKIDSLSNLLNQVDVLAKSRVREAVNPLSGDRLKSAQKNAESILSDKRTIPPPRRLEQASSGVKELRDELKSISLSPLKASPLKYNRRNGGTGSNFATSTPNPSSTFRSNMRIAEQRSMEEISSIESSKRKLNV